MAAAGEAGWSPVLLELDETLPGRLQGVEVAFPIAHGALGEDGCLQGLLEVLGVPYVGSDVRGSAIAAHKPTAKVMFQRCGLPTAQGAVVARPTSPDRGNQASQSDLPATVDAGELISQLGANLVVKPAAGGSAIGVHLLSSTSDAALREALDAVLQSDDALVEQLHKGEEVTCGVLADQGSASALPPTRIFAQAAAWYDFKSRYGTGGSRHECPARLPSETTAQIQRLAVAAHEAVGARDLSRVDFVLTSAGPIVLEVNTLPGMTETSLFPEAAAAAGVSFVELCDRLLQAAATRPGRPAADAPAMPD